MSRRPPLSDLTRRLTYHNGGYNVPPRLSPPVKETLNRRHVSELPFCKARLHTSTSGLALHALGFANLRVNC